MSTMKLYISTTYGMPFGGQMAASRHMSEFSLPHPLIVTEMT
jgi:hypothetical protein